MAIDKKGSATDALEELPRKVEFWELKYLGRTRTLQKFLRDGIKLDGRIIIFNGVPIFLTGDMDDEFFGYHEIFLTPEIEGFIFSYLLTGNSKDIPKLDLQYKDIQPWADDTHIYRHLKREIRRKVKLTWIKHENGIGVVAPYPYGSIEYGVFPHSKEELLSILEEIESYPYLSEYDIQEIHSGSFTPEELSISLGERLDAVYGDGIPTNIILNKTICGIGATYLEIEIAKRHSIIIEPNIPVIVGKERDHPRIIGVYGEESIKEKLTDKIAERIKEKEYVKILTTPDSFHKVIKALESLDIPFRDEFFLLFDECDKIVTDIDFRGRMSLPIDEFFAFTNKAMVSATPIIIDDPRFKEQGFRIVKIKPDYHYAKKLELKPTNNVNLMLKRTLAELVKKDKNTKFCIFFNYVGGITKMIDYLKISDKASIYCGENSYKKLDKEKGWKKNVYDNLRYENKTVKLTTQYNFFTSRYYSAVDINLDYKPVVIMVTMIYKALPNKTPFTLIDPAIEAVQIAGRFRNGVSRIIHIADTNPEIACQRKEQLKDSLEKQHSGHLKMRALENTLTGYWERHIANQAITRTDYYLQGYVTDKDEINYFRYNNAYLDERLKMLYAHPARLHKAYLQSEAFELYSESTYCAYSEQELKELRKKNTPRSEKIRILHNIYQELAISSDSSAIQAFEEFKKEFFPFFDAFETIGYQRVKQLDLNSDIEKEVYAFRLKEQLTAENVTNEVYAIFKEDEKYTTAFINEQLEEIFDRHNISFGRKVKAEDMEYYFQIEPANTGRARGWKLLSKRTD